MEHRQDNVQKKENRKRISTAIRSTFSVLAVLLLFQASPLSAQPNLNFSRVESNWPTIELYFFVGCDGEQAFSMTKQDFRILENGREIPEFVLWCPDPTIRVATSYSIVLDASAAMAGEGTTAAKLAAHAVIDSLDGEIDEANVLYFDSKIRVMQQMSTDTTMLRSAVEGLTASGGAALWDGAYAGIIEVINMGVNQARAVILISRGLDDGSLRTLSEVIALANRHRIRIFSIGVGSGIDSTDLRQLAQLTAGVYYHAPEEVELPAIVGEIGRLSMPFALECIISYESSCPDGTIRTVEMILENYCSGDDSKTKTYRAPYDSLAMAALKPVITRTGNMLESTPAQHYVWLRDGQPLTGDTMQVLPLPGTGVYRVRITDEGGCSAESDEFAVTVLGVSSSATAHSLDIYPDPSRGPITVDLRLDRAEVVRLRVLDLLGRELSRHESSGPVRTFTRQLDLGARSGTYFIHITAGTQVFTRRVVRME